MATRSHILTPDDVVDLPRGAGIRGHELVGGRVLPLRTATPRNRQLQAAVLRRITDHVIARRLTGTVFGDVAFVLGLRRDRGRVRVADIAYVARDDVDRHVEPHDVFRCVPELVVEFQLSGVEKPDGAQRVIDFVEAGVRVVWVLDAHGRAALAYNRGEGARQLREDDIIDAAPVMPRLRLPLRELLGLT